jgi:hypothetical protein
MKSIDRVSVYRYQRIEHRLRINKGGGILVDPKFFYGEISGRFWGLGDELGEEFFGNFKISGDGLDIVEIVDRVDQF